MHHWWLLLGLSVAACGGAAPAATAPAPQPRVAPRQPQLPARPPNTLYRDEILEAKRVGLGHVFELMELEPVGDLDARGKMADFKGFQIRALRPAREWLAFDFAPGDVLTHINGVSVEHYSTWFEQFEALPKAEQIRVDLIRDGSQKTILVNIVDRRAAAANTPVSQPVNKAPSSAAAPPAKPAAAGP